MSSPFRPRVSTRPNCFVSSASVAVPAALCALLCSAPAGAQTAKQAPTELPEVTITTTEPEAGKATPANAAKASASASAAKSVPMPSAEAAPAQTRPAPGSRSGSLTVPTTAEAAAEIERTPGAVEVVPGSAYQSSTPAMTIKDALDYVPGVLVQPKWGDHTRLSIRGSGL